MVVDDDPLARDLLQRFLRTEGFRVIGAPGGAEGLHLARALHPDVITLDVMMPDRCSRRPCGAGAPWSAAGAPMGGDRPLLAAAARQLHALPVPGVSVAPSAGRRPVPVARGA